jgi:predicted ATPase
MSGGRRCVRRRRQLAANTSQGAAAAGQVAAQPHAAILINALKEQKGCHCITLEKSFGETSIAGLRPIDRIPWSRPSR